MPTTIRNLLALAALGVATFLQGTLHAQTAAQLAQGAEAARAATEATEGLLRELQVISRECRATIATLEQSLEILREVKLDQAATDVAAILAATRRTHADLEERIDQIQRLKEDGAPAESDPLKDVLQRIEAIQTNSNAADRLDQQRLRLEALLQEVNEDDRLKPFASLVHYHLGAVAYDQATALNRARKFTNARKKFRVASESFEEAADDARPDVRNTPLGSSLRATAIYRLVVTYAVLASGGGVSKSQRTKYQRAAQKWYDLLREQYSAETLDNQQSVVQEARRQVERTR